MFGTQHFSFSDVLDQRGGPRAGKFSFSKDIPNKAVEHDSGENQYADFVPVRLEKSDA